MMHKSINRTYLETLSSSDLMGIADEYGIDVPEKLNRGFLIGEILEAAADADLVSDDSEVTFSDEIPEHSSSELVPKSYNSTEVKIMLRNPAWAFIYWNISEADQISLESAFVSEMKLRVNSYSTRDQQKADEYFDVQISKEDNGQYVLLPPGKKFFRVDLLFKLDGIIDILASSNILEMPKNSPFLANIKPGKLSGITPVLKASGMEELLLQHYQNHRESFS
ncbi:MAG: DUF4912 domain-containing protein [Treponema sp.]|nr:DUF4912 domain-containing protein [Treponema sp.]